MVSTLLFHCRAGVQFLVGKLRSCKPCRVAKKQNNFNVIIQENKKPSAKEYLPHRVSVRVELACTKHLGVPDVCQVLCRR